VITVKLRGGFANQNFQYLAGLAQAKRFGVPLQLDVTSFTRDSMRRYNLDLWAGVDERTVEGTETTIEEDGLPFNQQVWDLINDHSCLNGYWQTEKYWKDFISPFEVKRIFSPRAKLTLQGISVLDKIKRAGDRSVFLTVRRTDYVNNSFYHQLDLDYYLKALDIIKNRVGKELLVFIFSDDPIWVKDNFKIPCDKVIAGNFNMTTRDYLGREDQEIFLMSLCSHAVCANSSYSWFGAYLGEHPVQMPNGLVYPDNRVVVAPAKWFGPTSHEDARDIVPDRWIKL
jgi:hypothetical protein